MCGHATLATGFVLFNFYEKNASKITFHTMKSGDLFVSKDDGFILMDFPSYKLNKIEVTNEMEEAFGARRRSSLQAERKPDFNRRKSGAVRKVGDFCGLVGRI